MFAFQISPTQIMVVPVGPSINEYARSVAQQLYELGYMAESNTDDGETMNKKIRNAQLGHYNFILVVGDKEKTANTVNVRTRDNKVHGEFSIADLIVKLQRFRDEFIIDEENF